MRIFLQTPRPSQQTPSAKSTIPGRAHFEHGHAVRSILHSQRTIGNQAVQKMLPAHGGELKAASTATAPPRFERDFRQLPGGPPVTGTLQTKPVVDQVGDASARAADLGASSDVEQTAVPPIVHEVLRSPGRPLDLATRALMESTFGHDFGGVRVHIDAKAAASADAVKARAYAVGQDVVLGGSQPPPETAAGRRLLAHELAHVVQQSRGGRTPAVHSSASHEQEAEAAATAMTAGQTRVPVRQSTGVGLARQPKAQPPGRDIDVEKLLRPAGVTDPRSSPRYVDKLFQNVTYSAFTGASVFHWEENGKDKSIGVPLVDLEQDDTLTFVPILDIYSTKAEALRVVQQYALTASHFKFYTFYRVEGDIIMPTCFSVHSTPEFHKLWPGLKKGIAEEAEEIRRALTPLANIINPLPGTKVDEHGNLSVSGDPLDWLALLKLRRLSKIKEAGPITRRRHSGYDVPYTVVGPHGKLKGTSVYVLKDAQGTVLYVGKGDTLSRLREHIKDPKKTQWFGEIANVEVRATGLSNTQALALEENLIGQLGPRHNVDRNPFRKEFGNTMEVAPNLPKTQKLLTFWLTWGH